MSLAKKGKKLSTEHRTNISLGKIGDKHHLFGKKRSLDTIKKMSKAAKLNWEKLKSDKIPYKKLPMTEITKSKLSKSIILLDKNFIEVKKFSSTTIALKELKIGHAKLLSLLNKNYLLDEKYYLKSSTLLSSKDFPCDIKK
jgi:hypothetical protein